MDLRHRESQVEIVVSDSRDGIPPSFLPYVFERFRQADGTTSRRHGGLGLGLTIVRYLTEAHGGSVEVSSAGEGLGTTFVVQLPLLAVSLREPVDRLKVTGHAERLDSSRILVVDDDEDARELIRVMLTDRGGDVTVVESAGAALHAISRDRYDLLLADIGMPEQDGYSLIQAVRAVLARREAVSPRSR